MDSPLPAPAELERLLQHRDWLRALARRLAGEAAADDLVQETWLAALKRPPDPDRPLRPWLAGVVRKLARMRARGEGRRARRQQVAARRDELPSTAELIENVDTQRRLASVVLELEEPYRTTVLLRYFHDLPAAEIARRQELPAGTVRWRLKRGLDELRQRLDREWGDRRRWGVALVALAEGGDTAGGLALSGLLASLWARLAVAAVLLAALVLSIGALGPGGATPAAHAPARARVDLSSPLAGAAPGVVDARALRADASPSAARVVVLTETDGRVLANQPAAWVVGEALHPLTSDGAGHVELPGEAAGVLWITRPGAFPARLELDPEPGVTTLELAEGLAVEGTVHVDGDVPPPLVLALDYDRLLYPEPVPLPVRLELGAWRRAIATTDAGGAFRFHGLPTGWSGELWTPAGWLTVGLDGAPLAPHHSLHLRGAREGTRVAVARLPIVRGSVVEDGLPVPHVVVGARAQFRGEHAFKQAESGEDGAFELHLNRPGVGALELELFHAGRATRVSWDEVELSLGAEVDLGALELTAELRRIELHLIDSRGQPIAAGRARALPAVGSGGASDAGGRLVLGLGPTTTELEVGGAGWRPRVVPVPVGDEPLTVQLSPAARVALSVSDPNGAPVGPSRVRVVAEGALYVAGGPPLGADDLAGTFRGVTSRAARYVTDERGRLDLEGLAPGVAFDVEVLDSLARPIARAQLVAPIDDGREEHALVCDASPASLRGTCVAAEGEVLLGVDVSLSGRGRPLSQRTDVDGGFALEGIGPEPFDLELRKRGFVPVRFEGLTVSAGEEPRRFRLDPGRDLVFTVEDPAGGPVSGGALTAHRGNVTWTADEVAPGVLRLLDLPASDEVQLKLLLAGASYAPRDGGGVEQRFEVPAHAPLAVEWSRDGSATGWSWRLVLEGPGAGHVIEQALPDGPPAGRAELGPLPVGAYALFLERALAGRAPGPWERVGERQRVDVAAGVGGIATVTLR